MGRDSRVRGVVVAFVTAIAVMVFGDAGCASKVSGNGDETHFETCKVDADCRTDGGVGKHCVVGICRVVIEDGGAGGATGSPGAGGRGGAGGSTHPGEGGASSGGQLGICDLINSTNGDSDAASVKASLGDAAVNCTLQASDYDRSCTKDADCVEVGEGNACTLPCGVKCPTTAINGGALAAYQADYDRTPLASCPDLFCGCPARGVPQCMQGKCKLSAVGDRPPNCSFGPAGALLSRDEYCKSGFGYCPATLSQMLAGHQCTDGDTAEPCYSGHGDCALTVYEGCGETAVNPHGPYFNEYDFDTASGSLIGAQYSDDIPNGRCDSFGYYFGVASHDWEATDLPFHCASFKVSTCRLVADGGTGADAAPP
jgi:hypothetical protein